MAKDYTKKPSRSSCGTAHYPTKSVARLASGGMVPPERKSIAFKDMMQSWQNAYRSGDYGPNFIRRPNDMRGGPANNMFAAMAFRHWNNSQVKKKNG